MGLKLAKKSELVTESINYRLRFRNIGDKGFFRTCYCFMLMKIILLKEVPGLGHAGEVKEAKEGYARNFLIPKGMVDVMTKHSLNVLAAQKRKREKVEKLEVRSKKAEAKKINKKNFVIKVKADDKGTLYAKLDVKSIAAELVNQGHKVSQDEIRLKEPIKKIGQYDVELRLAGGKTIIKLKLESK